VGLIQRAIEAAGIPTVSISILRDVTEKVKPPRALFLRWPFGHPLGQPFNVAQQLTVLYDALLFLYMARPGEIRDLPYRWRREHYSVPEMWKQSLSPGVPGNNPPSAR
jgi:D-proline reductase (dithiol) PrdB